MNNTVEARALVKHTRIADGREGGGELLGPEQVHSGPNQQVLMCVDGGDMAM